VHLRIENEYVPLFGFYFILGAQAPGTQVELFRLAVDHDGSGVDIGIEPAIGMALGMADILTEHRTFTT
jgi:hypothetical protein